MQQGQLHQQECCVLVFPFNLTRSHFFFFSADNAQDTHYFLNVSLIGVIFARYLFVKQPGYGKDCIFRIFFIIIARMSNVFRFL